MIKTLKSKLAQFAELTRAYALPVTFASLAVIFAYSFYDAKFTFLNFILLSIALCCVHLGANLFDDYIDVKRKLKQANNNLCDVRFYSYIPKARLILNGTYGFSKIERILNILFSVAIGIGVCFIIFAGWKVLIFMLLGAVLTLLYPISSKFYLAEIIIGLIYGPLMINGGYYALTSNFNSGLLILSFAVFFATLVLLHAHNLMDWEFDLKENKNTLCILLKNKQKALSALKWLIIAAYAIIFIGVIMLQFSPHTLYVFLTLPIAVKLLDSMKSYINIENVEFKPKWYLGFFENWSAIKENKIDFFMYRFYLARNFAFFFALFAAVGSTMQ